MSGEGRGKFSRHQEKVARDLESLAVAKNSIMKSNYMEWIWNLLGILQEEEGCAWCACVFCSGDQIAVEIQLQPSSRKLSSQSASERAIHSVCRQSARSERATEQPSNPSSQPYVGWLVRWLDGWLVGRSVELLFHDLFIHVKLLI